MLSAVLLRLVVLNVTILSVVILSVIIMFSVTQQRVVLLCHNTEWSYAASR